MAKVTRDEVCKDRLFVVTTRDHWTGPGNASGMHTCVLLVRISNVDQHNAQWKLVRVISETGAPPKNARKPAKCGGFALRFTSDCVSYPSFADFQATGRDVPDLRKVKELEGCVDFDDVRPGRIYLDGMDYIEKETNGSWYLMIERSEFYSSKLEELELELYHFFCADHYS